MNVTIDGQEFELVPYKQLKGARLKDAVDYDTVYTLEPIKKVNLDNWFLELRRVGGKDSPHSYHYATMLTDETAEALAEALKAVVEYVTTAQIGNWDYFDDKLDKARDAYQGDQQ